MTLDVYRGRKTTMQQQSMYMYFHFWYPNSLITKKADDKIFVCRFSKNVKPKLYHIENSKTKGQTV